MVYHTLLCFLLFLSELEAHRDAGKAMSLTPPVVGLKDAEPSLRLGVEVKPQARRRRTLKLELSARHLTQRLELAQLSKNISDRAFHLRHIKPPIASVSPLLRKVVRKLEN